MSKNKLLSWAIGAVIGTSALSSCSPAQKVAKATDQAFMNDIKLKTPVEFEIDNAVKNPAELTGAPDSLFHDNMTRREVADALLYHAQFYVDTKDERKEMKNAIKSIKNNEKKRDKEFDTYAYWAEKRANDTSGNRTNIAMYNFGMNSALKQIAHFNKKTLKVATNVHNKVLENNR